MRGRDRGGGSRRRRRGGSAARRGRSSRDFPERVAAGSDFVDGRVGIGDAVAIVVDGEDAGVDAKTLLGEDFERLERLFRDREAGGAVGDDRRAGEDARAGRANGGCRGGTRRAIDRKRGGVRSRGRRFHARGRGSRGRGRVAVSAIQPRTKRWRGRRGGRRGRASAACWRRRGGRTKANRRGGPRVERGDLEVVFEVDGEGVGGRSHQWSASLSAVSYRGKGQVRERNEEGRKSNGSKASRNVEAGAWEPKESKAKPSWTGFGLRNYFVI